MNRYIFAILASIMAVTSATLSYSTEYEIYDPELNINGNRAEVSFSVGEAMDDPIYQTLILYWEGGVNSEPFNESSVVCHGRSDRCYTVESLLQQGFRIRSLNLYPSGTSAIVIFEKKNANSAK
jgi:hypothetical protein